MHEAKAVPYLSSPTDRRGSAADLVGERKAQSHSDCHSPDSCRGRASAFTALAKLDL